MPIEKGTHVYAVHPHWTGHLKLSDSGDRILHEAVGSTGRYEFADGRLTVFWDTFSSDVFIAQGDFYIQEGLLESLPRLDQLSLIAYANSALRVSGVSVTVPETNYNVTLRLHTSDPPTFDQVFLAKDYQSPNLPESAETIVDLGANVGFASVFFGLKYPAAKLLVVEPEPSNYAAMLSNVAALGPRVQTQFGAAWAYDGWINVHTEASDGTPLHAWGVQVSEAAANVANRTQCFRLDTLLRQARFETADILKVDIEGAELEVFASSPELWLPKVKLVIAETHDRFRPGSEDALRKALAANFEELPSRGENLFFRRRT